MTVNQAAVAKSIEASKENMGKKLLSLEQHGICAFESGLEGKVVYGKTALPIVPVMVTKPVHQNGEQISTHALLDCGSTRTLCTKQLVEVLELESLPTQNTIDTVRPNANKVTQKVNVMEKWEFC